MIFPRLYSAGVPSGFWANYFIKASFVGSGMAAHHAFFGGGDARS